MAQNANTVYVVVRFTSAGIEKVSEYRFAVLAKEHAKKLAEEDALDMTHQNLSHST
jgi:hypothetical protein